MRISVASTDDAPRATALFNAAFDDRVITEVGVRYRQASAQPEDRVLYLRAERGSELVGWAFGGLDVFASSATMGYAGIIVHPDRRRAGTGSALWDRMSQHLDEIGARRVVVHSRADPDSVAFARRCGFSLEATDTTSAVDPRTIGTPPEPPVGIGIAPMEDFSDDPAPVFEADSASAVDEPGPSDFSGATLESWRRLIWDMPDCAHDLSVVALADGAPVGTSFLYADRETGRALNAGTGVIREFRGRGLGLLMKQHSLALAAAAGITKVITMNDETNAPMLAINAKLGYQPLSSGHSWVLER
jgi:GNAT superfamily N-acetyltransferase